MLLVVLAVALPTTHDGALAAQLRAPGPSDSDGVRLGAFTEPPVNNSRVGDLEDGLRQEPKLYDDSILHEVEIQFEDDNWERLLERMNPANPTDLPASLTVDGTTLDRVGVRYKGNTSQHVASSKKPFNVKTHAFIDGQDLWGYDVINLNNAASDPSMLREALGYQILRDWMPVPQTAFARVTVQGRYLGVYLMVEQINREMVEAWFPTDDGIVIKGDPAAGARLNTSALAWLGESPRLYEPFYEVKTDGKEQTGYEHLRDLARELSAHESQGGLADAEFEEGIRRVLDVESALWYLAGSNLIQNGDSYYAGHNYYLYETARERRFNLLSWDLNMSFGVFPIGRTLRGRPQPGGGGDLAEQSPFVGEGVRERPLIRRLLANDTYRADYIAHYRALRDESYVPEDVAASASVFHELIRESVRDEPDPIFTFAQFLQNLESEVTIRDRVNVMFAPGVLALARQRYEYALGHPDLQCPDVTLAAAELEPAEPTAADEVVVRASYGGSSGIATSELRYRVDGGPERRIPMTSTGDNAWQAAVPAQREGSEVSYVLRVGVEDGRAEFFPSATLTRAFVYNVAGVELPRVAAGDLVLNELMAANDGTIQDEAGEYDDWLELYNRGTEAVELEGLYISDDPTDPWAYSLGEVQDELAAGEYLLIWCDNDTEQGANHAPFALSRDGESAVLSTMAAVVDQVDFGELEADVSYAREADGGEPWVVCHTPSPGARNACGPVEPTPTPTGATATAATTTPRPTDETPTHTPTGGTPTKATSTPRATTPTLEPTDRTPTRTVLRWPVYLPFADRH